MKNKLTSSEIEMIKMVLGQRIVENKECIDASSYDSGCNLTPILKLQNENLEIIIKKLGGGTK